MMVKQFKKYGVDHNALYEAVNRDNRYHDDKPKPAPAQEAPIAEPASVIEPPTRAAEETDKLSPSVAPERPAEQPTPNDPADVEPEVTPPVTAPKQKTPPKQQPKSEPDAASVMVRMRTRFPAEGVSPSYDALVNAHGAELAFKALFRRAFDEYRDALDAGSLPEGPRDYAFGKGSHNSTRMLTAAQYRICMAALDPSGMLPPMTVGRIIGERALALFFEKERKAKA